jgi:hypothetical protein
VKMSNDNNEHQPPLADGTFLDQYMEVCQRHIASTTGYNIKLKIKEHLFFSEILSNVATGAVEAPAHEVLLRDGNCILLACARLLKNEVWLMAILDETPSDPDTLSSRSRLYKDCCSMAAAFLLPCLRPTYVDIGSLWLIHCDRRGVPHCIAMKVIDGSTCQIWEGSETYFISTVSMITAFKSCMDNKFIVCFRVFKENDPRAHELLPEFMASKASNLLFLQAGAGEPPVNDVKPSDSYVNFPVVDTKDPLDESVVHVDAALYGLLQQEIATELERVRTIIAGSRFRHGGTIRCKYCIFDQFTNSTKGLLDYVDHLMRVHLFSLEAAIVGDSMFYGIVNQKRGGSHVSIGCLCLYIARQVVLVVLYVPCSIFFFVDMFNVNPAWVG